MTSKTPMRWLAPVLVVAACSSTEPPTQPRPAPRPPHAAAPPETASAAAPPPPRIDAPPPNPEDVAEAKQLVKKGTELYGQGRYGEAEEKLKGAMTLYPFLPEANLVLGKIFLIRASATRDITLMNNARLMLEMARALDPAGQEVRTLLELFHTEAGP